MSRLLLSRSTPSIYKVCSRFKSTNFGLTNRDRRRFYKQVSIVESSETPTSYEILLDHRKLRTPVGTIVRTDSEFLASALAQEWNQQSEKIDLSSMHIYSLINTIIDNPLHLTKNQFIDKVMYFLDWDTLLHRLDRPEEFRQLQIKSWDPILALINKEFQTNFQSTYDLNMSDLIKENDRKIIEKYLLSFDQSSLNIFLFLVEQIKSVLLAICLVKQYRSVEEITRLSRLETEYQISVCGNVEYHHDYELMDMRSKIAAAYLVFYCLNNNITRTVVNKGTV